MKEQFDKELRNHIRDTFDHFDDQLADDGWKKFKSQRRRKKRGLIFWYAIPSGIAAALALVWLLNIYDSSSTQNTIAQNNQAKPEQKEQMITAAPSEKTPQQNTAPAKVNQVVSESKQQEQKGLSNTSKQKTLIATQQIKETHSNKISNLNTALSEVKINSKEQISTQIASEPSQDLTIKSFPIEKNNEVDYSRASLLEAHEKGLALANADLNPKPTLFLAHAADQKNPTTTKKNKLKVALDANTFMNYSEAGLNNQINLGLGVSTDLKISKHLSLNSGIMLNRQTSTFDGNNKVDNGFRLSSFSTMVSVPKSQITNAKLVGLDIPLNLKFSMIMGKTRTFLSTGFSSYSVINERYVNDYSVVNYSITGIRANRITTIQDNPAGSFSYFKFAQSLNFSFGVLYPISKNSTLSVEPFVKYPLSGLGYQDLLIGAGGVSFKLNFGQ